MIHSCKTKSTAKEVLPLFNIFPLAITLGWLTGFDGKWGGLIRDHSKFSELLVSSASTNLFVPYGAFDINEWYFVGPLYIATVHEIQTIEVEYPVFVDEEFYLEKSEDQEGEFSKHKVPTLDVGGVMFFFLSRKCQEMNAPK